MSDTLKPCPFCGNKAESITVIGAPHVVCTNDQCALWATSAKIPLKEWNTRPAVTDEPADAMLDAGCDAYIQHRVLRSTPAVTVRGIWQAMNAALEKAGDE